MKDRLNGNHKKNFGCPVQGAINVLSGKWKVLVVWHLGFSPRHFAELRDLLPGRRVGLVVALEVVRHRDDGLVVVADEHDLRRLVEELRVRLGDVEAAECQDCWRGERDDEQGGDERGDWPHDEVLH